MMTGDSDPMAEIRASYFDECEELLERLQDGLQAMPDEKADCETINVVFRAVHSIKGGAGVFGLETLVRFAHCFEAVLVEVRADRLDLNQDTLGQLFSAADHLSDLIRYARDNQVFPADQTSAFETLLKKMIDPTSTFEGAISVAKRETQQITDASDAEMDRSDVPPRNSAPFIRVDNNRVERLASLVGELVINQSMLFQSLEKMGLAPYSDTMKGLEEFKRLTHDIQDSVIMIRAQPVKSLFLRMSRIVREAAATIGKEVQFNTRGDSTEVDKSVIERLIDPLTHLIRNAVDHGIETPEDRITAGKQVPGQIDISAAHRAGRLLIEVSDDGAGINRANVLQAAVGLGVVTQQTKLVEAEIDELLFQPGVSTAPAISDLSGRGVGMDVVRTAILAMGGQIAVTSQLGKGTTISISLPLTLAVLDGMVVKVAGETLIIPLNIVLEVLRLRSADVQTIPPSQNVLQLRGEIVPFLDLGVALGLRKSRVDIENAIVLLITQESGKKSAVLIDKIEDQRQVVVKGLDAHCHPAPGIAAATILGDGQIALILDPAELEAAEQTSPIAAQTPVFAGFCA